MDFLITDVNILFYTVALTCLLTYSMEHSFLSPLKIKIHGKKSPRRDLFSGLKGKIRPTNVPQARQICMDKSESVNHVIVSNIRNMPQSK
jgi:hypothetical protein